MKYCIAAGIIALGQAASAGTLTFSYYDPNAMFTDYVTGAVTPTDFSMSFAFETEPGFVLAGFEYDAGVFVNEYDLSAVASSVIEDAETNRDVTISQLPDLQYYSGKIEFMNEFYISFDANENFTFYSYFTAGADFFSMAANGSTEISSGSGDLGQLELETQGVWVIVNEPSPVPLPASGFALLAGLGLLSIKRLRTSHYPA